MAKTDNTMLNDIEMEMAFQAARDSAPIPGDELLARIMADADSVQFTVPTPAPSRNRPGLWTALVAGIGGWPALAGMATATIAGIWIGFATPDTLFALSDGILPVGELDEISYELEDLVPGYGNLSGLLEEG